MQIKFRNILFGSAIAILISNCNSEPQTQKVELPALLETYLVNHHFGKIDIGTDKNELESFIQDSLVAGDDEESKYFGEINSKLKYDLFLVYDENRLFEITVDFKPIDDEYCGEVFAALKDIMDAEYGFNEGDNGYSTWKTASIDNKLIEVSLIDESEEYQHPFITLNYFEDIDKSYGD